MNSHPCISAIVVTLNEAAHIRDCLDSVSFCDERIVVDCGSTDDTVRIAKDAGAQVVHHEWPGYGAQKNFALSLATGDWVLSIDADERVTPELAASIQKAVDSGVADGCEVLRLATFCGREIRHGGWFPDWVVRLFRRGKGHFSDHVIHERLICEGRVERIAGLLMHQHVDRIEQALVRMNRYSTAGAQALIESGQRNSFFLGFLHGAFAFLRSYIFRAGFLDGREGFLVSLVVAETTFYKYVKAWLMTRGVERPPA